MSKTQLNTKQTSDKTNMPFGENSDIVKTIEDSSTQTSEHNISLASLSKYKNLSNKIINTSLDVLTKDSLKSLHKREFSTSSQFDKGSKLIIIKSSKSRLPTPSSSDHQIPLIDELKSSTVPSQNNQQPTEETVTSLLDTFKNFRFFSEPVSKSKSKSDRDIKHIKIRTSDQNFDVVSDSGIERLRPGDNQSPTVGLTQKTYAKQFTKQNLIHPSEALKQRPSVESLRDRTQGTINLFNESLLGFQGYSGWYASNFPSAHTDQSLTVNKVTIAPNPQQPSKTKESVPSASQEQPRGSNLYYTGINTRQMTYSNNSESRNIVLFLISICISFLLLALILYLLLVNPFCTRETQGKALDVNKTESTKQNYQFIVYFIPIEYRYPKCLGVLINVHWILLSSSCIYDYAQNKSISGNIVKDQVTYYIQNVHFYEPNTSTVALIRLEKEIDIHDDNGFAKVPAASAHHIARGLIGVLITSTSDLQLGTTLVHIYPHSVCDGLRLLHNGSSESITSAVFCAGDIHGFGTNETDRECDSRRTLIGPVIVNESIVYGLYKQDDNFCRSKGTMPNMYFSISEYLNWIRNYL